MADNAAAFVGSIPELYDRHLGPVLFEPFAIDLGRRLPAGTTRVLEVAAGTGRLTRHLVAALPPGGTVLATDLNDAMIARGTQVIADPRVTWRQADAQELPVEDGAFDAVACQFGLMFVPDKPRAVREMRRALRQGGALLLSVWDHLENNPLMHAVHLRAMAAFPDDPPLFMQTPFSMPDPVVLGQLAREAGFASVRVDTVAMAGEASSADDLAIGFVRGNPLWNQLVERGVDAEGFQRAVADDLRRRCGDRPCRAPLVAHVLTAVA